jgi:hypothetical protein
MAMRMMMMMQQQQQQQRRASVVYDHRIMMMMMMIIVIVAAVVIIHAAAPSEASSPATLQYDLSLILPSTYSRFVAAANAVNITPYSLPPIFTLFAPINSAFEVHAN